MSLQRAKNSILAESNSSGGMETAEGKEEEVDDDDDGTEGEPREEEMIADDGVEAEDSCWIMRSNSFMRSKGFCISSSSWSR